ncbi:hypothetical protein G6K12_004339 [Escherichia coli]|uniref:hypothetical protein n=2 Tax=Escherichia TaxID=561 RepID=UPI0016B1A7BB|nr:hypothetical protein [Escherichia coli]EFA4879922.1 hypothetical protein [Escherichia coli]EFK5321639.1 hypothetical protein [Escherichia coli]HAW3708069.1 hypothetical protein [Escherichia coli]
MNTQNVNVKTATRESSERWGTKTSVLFALANIEGQFLYLRSQYRLGLTDSVQREKIAAKHCQALITEFNNLLFWPEGLSESMTWDIVRVAKELPWTPWNWDPLCPF